MRFKKGSKVEVMSKNEMPISWRCAEIVSGNGHTYSVKYDHCCPDSMNEKVERVSRKVIRPCPPMECAQSWVAGDIVEVFHEDSWKTATVSNVFGMDYYVVRLHGISRECRVRKSSIRMRQFWQEGQWVMIGMGSGSFEDANSNDLSTPKCHQKKSFGVPQLKINCKPQADHDCSRVVYSRSRKRALPYSSSNVEARAGKVLKLTATGKEGRKERADAAPLLEKVDAVAYPCQNLGEKYMHASFNIRSKGNYEKKRANINGVVGCSPARSSEPNGYDSDMCSVGSCSVTSRSPNKFSSRVVAIPSESVDTLCSDAESCSGSRDEEESCSFLSKEEVAASIHGLELHAYRCTLEALYASGPLSWEQEGMLTNLRIMLHISNDQHLMELRSLVSSGGVIRNSQ